MADTFGSLVSSPPTPVGQQQLLLLVLGIVIVGLAVVTGLTLFTDSRARAAGDEMVAVGARIASEGTAWALLPAQMGGGGGSPAALTFRDLGYATRADGTYATGDATYALAATATEFVVTGTDNQARATSVTAVYGVGEGCLALALTRDATVPDTPERPAGCSGW